MKTPAIPCAIYTRKSSEEGLEQDFNSLDAQREACEAFIVSQKALGWVASKAIYDDGGFSGGSTDRPALQRLLADISLGKVKVVVVYKVDRLTRSLADFAKIVELFDSQGVSFVSVTQQFNTTSSMGRLTLNVLLSFAQFEREVTGERIRDKIAASKKKGMWMGGTTPMGYLPFERTLVIDEPQAARVRQIFQWYLELGCVRKLALALKDKGWLTPPRDNPVLCGEKPLGRGHLYRILRNPVYIGQIVHKDQIYPGNHPPIVDESLWQQVQERLENNRQGHKTRTTTQSRYLLTGLVFDTDGNRFTGSHSKKQGTRSYRYYVQQVDASPMRIPSTDLEQTVLLALTGYLDDGPTLLADLPDHPMPTQLLADARDISTRLSEGDANTLRELLQQVTVAADELILELTLTPLGSENHKKRLTVPAKLQRSGLAMRLVVRGSQGNAGKPDPKLIRLITRSHDWAMRLISGRAKSVREIAEAEEVTATYVTRLAHIGFLAPDLMQAIVRGEQPPTLTAHSLANLGTLPLDWNEQRRVLGFGK